MFKKARDIMLVTGLLSFLLYTGNSQSEACEPLPELIIEEEPIITLIEPAPVVELTTEEPEPEPQPELISLGEFKLTAYCSCEKCCGKWAQNRPDGIVYGASGKELVPGYSIAVDPTVIPYGTTVIINEHEYEAMDCGGAIKDNRIDVYFDNHTDALEFGVQYAEVREVVR